MQRRALLAASLGWMLDSMDVMLYALVVPSMKGDLHLTSGGAGLIMSATLICAAIGGILFGVFADRFGRTRALIGSILVYCIFTGLCGFVHSAVQLAICRMLLGFGMGGEWAAGAALVAETWPDQHRGKALALMQSSWAIGYALGAAIVAVIMPHFGWRSVFFAGLLPALFAIWIRRRVSEPERWIAVAHAATNTTRPAQIFRGRNGRFLAIATLVNAATLFAWWGLFFGGAFLPILARITGWPRPQYRTNIDLDHPHAGRHFPWLCQLRISRRPLWPQVDLRRIPLHGSHRCAVLRSRNWRYPIAMAWPNRGLLGNRLFQRLRRHYQ